MQCRRRGRIRCLRRCYPRLAWRSREAASQCGPPASAAALALFVSRFGVGDTLLELAPRLSRRRTSRLIRVRHFTPLVVNSVECRFDSFLDAATYVAELLRYVAAHIFDEILRVLLDPPSTASDPGTRLFATPRREQQRGTGAERNA